jgi:hypothetical protein
LAAAARTALAPLGFWRKGKSRVWLADRGFWLAVVEFQPSGFGKGSYLNVAAHWLWSAMPDILSFDYAIERQKPWIEYTDDLGFAPLADQLALRAAEESRQLAGRIADLKTFADLLVANEAESASQGRGGGWSAFNAAIVAGISGNMAVAGTLFAAAYDSIGTWRPDLQVLLAPYAEALRDKSTFNKFIAQRVDEHRARYSLAPWVPG